MDTSAILVDANWATSVPVNASAVCREGATVSKPKKTAEDADGETLLAEEINVQREE